LPRTLIVIPTYNERECVEPVVAAVRAAVPQATIEIVDDNSPDGTGAVADQIAARDPQVRVLHRAQKAGLGAAYIQAFSEIDDEYLRERAADSDHPIGAAQRPAIELIIDPDLEILGRISMIESNPGKIPVESAEPDQEV